MSHLTLQQTTLGPTVARITAAASSDTACSLANAIACRWMDELEEGPPRRRLLDAVVWGHPEASTRTTRTPYVKNVQTLFPPTSKPSKRYTFIRRRSLPPVFSFFGDVPSHTILRGRNRWTLHYPRQARSERLRIS